MTKNTTQKKIRKYEYVNIEKLKPYTKNARTHSNNQIEKIRASIREFGFVNPVLIDGDFNIIAGHGRVDAAKAEGIKQVPCLFIEDMTEAQKRAYIIADNRLALDAGWDNEILKIELQELRGFDFDISLTGFDMDEINILLDESADIEEDDFDIEKALEGSEEPFTKRGDLWEIGKHRLFCGDSTEENDVATLMGDRKADMVFTDPPWNVNYGAVNDDNAQGYRPRTILNDFMGTEDFKAFMSKAFSNMNTASKEGCMPYVVMSAQEWGNVMLTLAGNAYHWSSTLIWNKDRLVLARKDYHTKYEPIWYGWKEGAARLRPLDDRKQSDVWDFERPSRSDEHPTMKPVALVDRAIRNSSKAKDVVLDLFGGSGTTMIAAERANRICYMMELDPKYCDVIIKRWETLTGQKAVLING